MKKLAIVAAVAVAIATVLKALTLYGGLVFYDYYISDECYYVTASSLLISRLLGTNYTPPYTIDFVVVNGTTTISISVGSWRYPVIAIPVYDWRNLEHPGFAKLVYGLVHHATGSLPGLRLTLLAVSATAYGVFAYAVTRRYGIKGVLGLAVFLLIDKLAIHYTYMAFLDSLMLVFLLFALSMYTLGRYRLSLTFLSLLSACKIPGVVSALAFAGAEYRRAGLRSAALFVSMPVLALLASYGLNLAVASPDEVARAVLGIATLKDYTSCSTPLCLFALEEPWGIVVFTPAFLWLWLAVLLVKSLDGEKELVSDRNLALNVALLNLLFTVTTAISRAIYVFYYLPAVATVPIAVAELVEHLYRFGHKQFIGVKMRASFKGQALSIEALIIGMASLLIIAFALRYATSLMVNPTISQGSLEGRLCGNVLLLTNTGRIPVTIDNAIAVPVGTGAPTTITQHINPSTIQPGTTVKAIIPATTEIDYVTITGQDLPVMTIRNECRR